MTAASFHISSLQGSFRFSSAIPAKLLSHRFNGAAALYGTDGLNHCLFQKVRNSDITMYCCDFIIAGAAVIRFFSEAAFTGITMITQGTASPAFNGISAGRDSAGTYRLLRMPFISCDMHFTKAGKFSMVAIAFGEQILTRFLPAFESMAGFLSGSRSTMHQPWKGQSFTATTGMLLLLANIKTNTYRRLPAIFYAGLKTMELLFLALAAAERYDNARKAGISRADAELIRAVMARISRSPEHDFTIKSLSREFGLNTNKLKTGFKLIYGDTVMGILTRQRMEIARQLLYEGRHSIREIALLTGYANSASFIHAFQRACGMSPGSVKTKGKQ